MRLGEMLYHDGYLSQAELEDALAYQVKHGGRLGEILIHKDFLEKETLEIYLRRQLSEVEKETISVHHLGS